MTAVSVLGVLMLAAMAWAFGFRGAPMLDEATARAEVEGTLPGFRPADVVLDAAGRAALVRGACGGVALVRAFGDRWVTRRLDERAQITREGGRLTVKVAEPMFGRVTLAPATWPGWIARLA